MQRIPGTAKRTVPSLALGACALIMFWIGPLYAWSVFVAPLEAVLGESRAAVSSVFSIANVGFTLALLFVPLLFGRVRLAWLSLATLALGAGGLALAGAQPSLWGVWIGYGGLFGIANGLGYALSLQVVQTALPGRSGFATGVVVSSYALGSMLWAPFLGWCITRYGPAPTLWGAAAAALLIGGAAHVMLLRSGAEIERPPDEAAPGPRRPAAVVALWCGFLGGSVAGMLTIGHAAPIVGALGGGSFALSLAVALVTVGNFLGRFAGGWTSDGINPRLTVSGTQCLAAAGVLLSLWAPSIVSALAMLFLVGFAYGWMSGAYPVMIGRIFGTRAVAKTYGTVNTAWGVSAGVAPYLGGFLYDQSGVYGGALAVAGASALFAGLCVACLRVGDE